MGIQTRKKNTLKPDRARNVCSSTWCKQGEFLQIITNSLMFSWPWFFLLCSCVFSMLLAYYMKYLKSDCCRQYHAVPGTLEVCWPGFPGLSEFTVILWGPL